MLNGFLVDLLRMLQCLVQYVLPSCQYEAGSVVVQNEFYEGANGVGLCVAESCLAVTQKCSAKEIVEVGRSVYCSSRRGEKRRQ